MSSLWTPDGERPVARAASSSPQSEEDVSGDPLRAAAAAIGVDLDSLTDEEKTQLQGELAEMMRVRREVAATPAAEMLANYLMRFFDLATIYLESEPPAFSEAATVIEAFRSVLDGLGDRLGEHRPMLSEALGQLQMVFVQVKQGTENSSPDSSTS
ncbi:MAG: hypothetical protein WD029_01150 [Microthrixaceae bacterium]